VDVSILLENYFYLFLNISLLYFFFLFDILVVLTKLLSERLLSVLIKLAVFCSFSCV
jgi:hypothetical protein